MNGMLILNGTGPKPVFVGNPPRWEENPCGVGGYTWTLSRLEYMATLCKAFLLTEDRRYLDKVESDLANWFETVPVPPIPHDYESACCYHAVHHWRMLEVGYRMVRTVPILLSVLRVHGRNTALLERLRRSIAEHTERIAAGSLLLWPGRDYNHYTTEINGLLSAASMIPEHPKAPAWADWAMDELEKACAAQITEDGAQIEGAAGYHTAAVIDFAYSIHFAAKCGRNFSPEFTFAGRDGTATQRACSSPAIVRSTTGTTPIWISWALFSAPTANGCCRTRAALPTKAAKTGICTSPRRYTAFPP